MQHIMDRIPIQHNLISYIMFLGIFQGALLSLVINIRIYKKNSPFRILGWFLLLQSIITLDNYLCYTGLMKHLLFFNDSTEPLVLLLGPSIYLFIFGLLERKPITFKKYGFHILPSVLYFVSQLRYYLNPLPVKLNAYIGAYFPKMQKAAVPDSVDYTYHWIKDEFRWLVLLSFIIYIIASIRVIYIHMYKNNTSTTKNALSDKYSFTRNMTTMFLVLFFIIFIVYWNFEDDTGDHYITTLVNFVVVLISFVMLLESRFFQNSWIADKYETSRIKNDSFSIKEIEEYIKNEKYYLLKSASLKDLATVLGSNANYISQTINANTNLNFNDFINQYRVEESKKRLLDEKYNHLTIEAIGNSVGFKSKATFYNAFKKYVELSPKAFIKTQKSTT